MLKKDRYQQLRAKRSCDFNCCYYCGCIATARDYAPPLKFVDYYLATGDSAVFYKLPSCLECETALKNKRLGTLEERMSAANKAISKKYQRAIRVYTMWHPDELDELDYELHRSISAGMALGEEAHQRIQFNGFDYEVDGDTVIASSNKVAFDVFGTQFDSFKMALDYASKTFRIPKAKLNELFCEHSHSFNKAITSFQQQQNDKSYEKELNRLCRDFASLYKQNLSFITRTVTSMLEQDTELTVQQALQKIKTGYIDT